MDRWVHTVKRTCSVHRRLLCTICTSHMKPGSGIYVQYVHSTTGLQKYIYNRVVSPLSARAVDKDILDRIVLPSIFGGRHYIHFKQWRM